MSGSIQVGSLVTLHFRVTHPDSGVTLISTFEANPGTMQIGAGELMPALEARLIGLGPSAREVFKFAPGEAFGIHHPQLVERVPLRDIPPGLIVEADTMLSFPAPDVSSYPGLVRELNEVDAVIDFNHPLAGKAVDIEVAIIGVI